MCSTERIPMSPSEEERTMLRDSVRNLLAEQWPAEHGSDWVNDVNRIRSVDDALCQLGLSQLGADREEGGLREILLVAQELGAAAFPSSLVTSMLLQCTLAQDANGSLQALLSDVATGTARVALALGGMDGAPGAGAATLGGGVLNGTVAFVEGAQWATHYLMVAADAKGQQALVIVDAGSAGLHACQTPGFAIPALTALTLQQVSVSPDNVHAQSRASLVQLRSIAQLIVMGRAYGSAKRAFDLVVEYSKERIQFGQPIGRFQAIQHKLADVLIRLEGVRLTLDSAATSVDRESQDRMFYVTAACAFASVSLREVSLQIQHTFGAIGYSEEHEAPRHFRRTHIDTIRFGGVRRAQEDLAALLIEGGHNLPEYDLGVAGNGFRSEVRQWLKERWENVYKAEHDAKPFHERRGDARFSGELGAQGWLALSWPKAFGGQERTPLEQLAFAEEFQMAGVPKPGGEIQAHALMRYGTAEQQQEYLPRIRAGSIRFCLGYSEPGSGSDLASVKTTAVRDGDEWVINGQKLWTTFAEDADYMWLAARTDPQAKTPHAGISVFIIPMNVAGMSVRPSMALYGHTFCSEFLDNVRVPASALIGQVNDGWKIITAALATERVQMGSFVAHARAAFERMLVAVRADPLLAEDKAVRARIGTLAAEIEVARQLLSQSILMMEQGKVPVHEAAMSKTFTGELLERLGETALDILGPGASLTEGSEGAVTNGKLEQLLRQSIMMVIGGGTAEIQRTLIAQRGLGLPR